jgi:multicomponent Na+:H+ antiporter subunit B
VSNHTQPTVIARTVTRAVFPLILLTAIALTLQGHNHPGGGFIGGVLTAIGIALVYIIYGADALTRLLFQAEEPSTVIRTYVQLLTVSLALAAGSGIAAIALGAAFLSQVVVFIPHVPIYGTIELPSALVFDLGVYLVVVGTLLTILAVVGIE